MNDDSETGRTRDRPHQDATSEQSLGNPDGCGTHGSTAQTPDGSGIGSSQRQDIARDDRAEDELRDGTPDIERARDPGATESLVNDPVGAFKERP